MNRHKGVGRKFLAVLLAGTVAVSPAAVSAVAEGQLLADGKYSSTEHVTVYTKDGGIAEEYDLTIELSVSEAFRKLFGNQCRFCRKPGAAPREVGPGVRTGFDGYGGEYRCGGGGYLYVKSGERGIKKCPE